METKKKKLKIMEVIEERKNGQIKIPEIKLRGKWLQNINFFEENYVEITYGKEYIIIHPYKNQES